MHSYLVYQTLAILFSVVGGLEIKFQAQIYNLAITCCGNIHCCDLRLGIQIYLEATLMPLPHAQGGSN